MTEQSVVSDETKGEWNVYSCPFHPPHVSFHYVPEPQAEDGNTGGTNREWGVKGVANGTNRACSPPHFPTFLSSVTHVPSSSYRCASGTAGERMVSGGEGMVVTRDVNVRQEPDDWENTPYIHILFLSLPSLSPSSPYHLLRVTLWAGGLATRRDTGRRWQGGECKVRGSGAVHVSLRSSHLRPFGPLFVSRSAPRAAPLPPAARSERNEVSEWREWTEDRRYGPLHITYSTRSAGRVRPFPHLSSLRFPTVPSLREVRRTRVVKVENGEWPTHERRRRDNRGNRLDDKQRQETDILP